MPSFEQHMLKDTASHKALLDRIDFGDAKVFEVGCGTGILSELIINKVGIDRFCGIEIDSSIVPASIADHITIGDFMTMNLDFLLAEKHILVANPPYSLLPDIKRLLIDSRLVEGYVLMTSDRIRQSLFPDAEIAFILAGDRFDPPANGDHYVVTNNISMRN